MTKVTPPAPKLWPATQLLVTADTADDAQALLDPQSQLRFLSDLSTLAGPDMFADSLVYSTPEGNTGWTALRMGPRGHATYHHWDVARPNLLQLDLYGIGAIDDQRAVAAVEEFWSPSGMRVIVMRRPDPTERFISDIRRDDTARRSGKQVGLGPGDHLHFMIDQVGAGRKKGISPPHLDAALERLVEVLKMRCMTSVMRHDRTQEDGFAYDAIVGITTSHVSLRLRQSGGLVSLSLDIFSCRKFDSDTVLQWLQRLLPTPDARRAVLYNRYPLGDFAEIW